MNHRKLSVPAMFAIGLALSGCVSFGAKPPPTLLSLTAARTIADDATNSGPAARALVVTDPQVSAKLASNRVPVQVDATSVAYLKGAQWIDQPARLLRNLIAETIAADGTLVLREDDTLGKANDFLSGQLVEFGVDAQRQEAVVIYDAVRLRGERAVSQRRFEERVPVAAIEGAPVGVALNSAANTVAADVAAWVKGAAAD